MFAMLLFPLAALLPLLGLFGRLQSLVIPSFGLQLQVDWTDIRAVMVWLAGVGAPYLVGKLVAYLAENWPAWHTFPRLVKFFAPMILSVALSAGATILLQYNDILTAISPYWIMIAGAVLFYLGSQVGYMDTKKAGYGYGPKLAIKKLEKELKESVS